MFEFLKKRTILQFNPMNSFLKGTIMIIKGNDNDNDKRVYFKISEGSLKEFEI